MISPFLKENGMTMSKGLKPLPLTLLFIGSNPSDVTWRRHKGTWTKVTVSFDAKNYFLGFSVARIRYMLWLLHPSPAPHIGASWEL